jgi:hypothetical protein
LHWSFWGVFTVAILTFATTWLIPVSREAGRKPPTQTEMQEALSS